MPTLLHEQTGLRVVQNDRNGFTVITLHYSADPRKRTEQWKREAHKGMSQAKYEQEYEIRYDAMMGEKVFPVLKDRQKEIVIAEGPFLDNRWPDNLTMWAGMDFGIRNPSSFHVYTMWDGVMYAIWELYEPCKNILEFSQKLISCPYYRQLRYIACDPHMKDNRSYDLRTGVQVSVRQQFEQCGITKLLDGTNNEQAWLSKMATLWPTSGEIGFKILTTCPMLIDEMLNATYVSMSDRQLETQDFREKMVDKYNHAMDDCKYFMNSNPAPRKSGTSRGKSILDSYNPWGHKQSVPYGRGLEIL